MKKRVTSASKEAPSRPAISAAWSAVETASGQIVMPMTARRTAQAIGNPRNVTPLKNCDGSVTKMTELCHAELPSKLKYHELVAGNRCARVVVAVETGGRWNSEAVDFVNSLAGACRGSSFFAWRRRSSKMIAVSCGRAFARSLVTSCSGTPYGQDGPPPDLADLLA